MTQPFSRVAMRASTGGSGAHWATNDPPSASASGLPVHGSLRNQQVPRIHARGITLAFSIAVLNSEGGEVEDEGAL
jgi:hypothetical protein